MTQTTRNLTGIFPVGFEGNNTGVASEEDNQRMKAWGEAMDKPKNMKTQRLPSRKTSR